MRTALPGLGTPYPIGSLLPPVMQEDPTAMRLTQAYDEVLAPVLATLDCLPAYVDTDVAPADFLEWLAGWVGATLDENWPAARQRATVSQAVTLHRTRGTVAGLRAHLEAATGLRVDVTDSGGVATSTTPDGELPGDPRPEVVVRVHGSPPAGLAAVERLVAAAKPAHIAHRVELVDPPRRQRG